MMPKSTTHLTNETLNDVLIGMASSESEAHLVVCRICRSKVEEFQSNLNDFDKASLAWSEVRNSAMEHIAAPTRRRTQHSVLRWALVAVVLLVSAISTFRHGDRFWSNQDTAQTSPHEDSDAQVAEDNALLQAVQVAIDQDDESLNRQYDSFERPQSRLKTRPE